jgi:hypothetical protein
MAGKARIWRRITILETHHHQMVMHPQISVGVFRWGKFSVKAELHGGCER